MLGRPIRSWVVHFGPHGRTYRPRMLQRSDANGPTLTHRRHKFEKPMRRCGQRAYPPMSARVQFGLAWKRPNGLPPLAIVLWPRRPTPALLLWSCHPTLALLLWSRHPTPTRLLWSRRPTSINAGVSFYAPASNALTIYTQANAGHSSTSTASAQPWLAA
jgi:hypothetical protein